jgi:hypothetical protein
MSTENFYTNQEEFWGLNQNDPIINRASTIKEVFNGIIKILVIIKGVDFLYLLFNKYINPDCNFINKDIKTDLSNDTIVSLLKNPVLNIETNIMIDNEEKDTNPLATTVFEQSNTNPPVCNDMHIIDLPGESRDVIIIE